MVNMIIDILLLSISIINIFIIAILIVKKKVDWAIALAFIQSLLWVFRLIGYI